MMKLQMYDTVVDVQEKNNAVIDVEKKNDASSKCTMQLRMYKKRMLKNKLQKGDVNLKCVPTRNMQQSNMDSKDVSMTIRCRDICH